MKCGLDRGCSMNMGRVAFPLVAYCLNIGSIGQTKLSNGYWAKSWLTGVKSRLPSTWAHSSSELPTAGDNQCTSGPITSHPAQLHPLHLARDEWGLRRAALPAGLAEPPAGSHSHPEKSNLGASSKTRHPAGPEREAGERLPRAARPPWSQGSLITRAGTRHRPGFQRWRRGPMHPPPAPGSARCCGSPFLLHA